MIRRSPWPCLLVLFAALASGCLAQPADSTRREHARSPFLSGMLEWTLPMAGYVYAEDVKRGIAPNLVRVGGLVLYFDGLGAGKINWPNPRAVSNALIGLGVGTAGSLWAIGGAVSATQQRNARLGLGLGANNGPTITLCIPL